MGFLVNPYPTIYLSWTILQSKLHRPSIQTYRLLRLIRSFSILELHYSTILQTGLSNTQGTLATTQGSPVPHSHQINETNKQQRTRRYYLLNTQGRLLTETSPISHYHSSNNYMLSLHTGIPTSLSEASYFGNGGGTDLPRDQLPSNYPPRHSRGPGTDPGPYLA